MFVKLKHETSSWIIEGILQYIQNGENWYKSQKVTDPNSPKFDIQKTI